MTDTHIQTGKIGESEGVAYLKQLGYRILEENYRTPFGEIDAIAKESGAIVFVEIKTRRGTGYGFPEEAVHERKQRKLVQSAQCYLKRVRKLSAPSRFDVLSISIRSDGGFEFNLIRNAFEVP